jgi:hypothetical protein
MLVEADAKVGLRGTPVNNFASRELFAIGRCLGVLMSDVSPGSAAVHKAMRAVTVHRTTEGSSLRLGRRTDEVRRVALEDVRAYNKVLGEIRVAVSL